MMPVFLNLSQFYLKNSMRESHISQAPAALQCPVSRAAARTAAASFVLTLARSLPLGTPIHSPFNPACKTVYASCIHDACPLAASNRPSCGNVISQILCAFVCRCVRASTRTRRGACANDCERGSDSLPLRERATPPSPPILLRRISSG
jgi:hypothetical protein